MTDHQHETSTFAVQYGPDGLPTGMVDVERVAAIALDLSLEIAANCGSPQTIDDIVRRYTNEYGVETCKIVAPIALKLLACDILDPALRKADSAIPAGAGLRANLQRIATQRRATS